MTVLDTSVVAELRIRAIRSDLPHARAAAIVATHARRYGEGILSWAAAVAHRATDAIASDDADPVWERVLEFAATARLLVSDVPAVVVAAAVGCDSWFDDEVVVTRFRRDVPFGNRRVLDTPAPPDR